MSNLLNYRDLLIRCFVVIIATFVLTLTAQKNQFDLHFKIRKTQQLSEQVQIINVENIEKIDEIIDQLISYEVRHIFISQYQSEMKHPKVTFFSTDEKNPNYLSFQLKPDSDGIIRKFKVLSNPVDDFLIFKNAGNYNINFLGPHDSFRTLNFKNIEKISHKIKHKVILLTSQDLQTQMTTPLGLLSETEMIANILDNSLENRFIADENQLLQFVVLTITLLLTLLLLIYLPSTLALISTFIFITFYLSLSLWFFDNYYIWTPLFSPLIQTILTFLLISNYKSILNERTRWHLEKESLLFDEVEEMKTNFLSLFSHDLKTPLAKIMGITETMLNQTQDSKIIDGLEKIKHSANDLEKYIKRILKMSQVQSKKIAIAKSPSDLNKLIDKAIESNLFIAAEKDILLEKKLTPLFMIDIDASLIQEVIINLIENAIKYSPAHTQITIRSEEFKNYIKFSVLDQGKGIPKEIQENIWEKYFRLETNESGYGLGLFLSRYVIQLHGGQVFLNSKENEGSEFGFLLPIQEEVK